MKDGDARNFTGDSFAVTHCSTAIHFAMSAIFFCRMEIQNPEFFFGVRFLTFLFFPLSCPIFPIFPSPPLYFQVFS